MKDISRLQEGVQLLKELEIKSKDFQRIIGVKHCDMHSAFDKWLAQPKPYIEPTWKKLLLLLRLIDLDQTAKRIEDCIYGISQVSKSITKKNSTTELKRKKTSSFEGLLSC